MDKEGKRVVQDVTGTFLYYAHAVDQIMLPALGSIASPQTNPTEQTMQHVNRNPVMVANMRPILRSPPSRVVSALEYSSDIQKKSWVGIPFNSALI